MKLQPSHSGNAADSSSGALQPSVRACSCTRRRSASGPPHRGLPNPARGLACARPLPHPHAVLHCAGERRRDGRRLPDCPRTAPPGRGARAAGIASPNPTLRHARLLRVLQVARQVLGRDLLEGRQRALERLVQQRRAHKLVSHVQQRVVVLQQAARAARGWYVEAAGSVASPQAALKQPAAG